MRRSYGAKRASLAALIVALLGTWVVWPQDSGDALVRGFQNPPDSAKPRTWWHWTGGNVTKEGITKDLEWMKRVGIGGMQTADVSSGSGQTVEKKLLWGTPDWMDAVKHAASEADRLGLEMSIFSSAGWSETGGPWVKPEQAMKKLVWSETGVEGPRSFTGKLAQPPSDNGTIRNLRTGGGRGGEPPDATYYGDSAVVAYPTPADEIRMQDRAPKATSNAGPIDATALMDDDLNSTLTLRPPEGGGAAYVQYEFAQPFPARAITIAGRGGIPTGRVLAGDDGVNFKTLVTLPGAQLYRGGTERTFAFPETNAKFFRVELTGGSLGPAVIMAGSPAPPASQYVLSEFMLYSGARVHRWEEKADFSYLFEYESVPTPAEPAAAEVPRADVIDLTSKMAKDGTLHWDVPAGKWTILRMGYSLTGAKNRPAPATGLGFEADKLSRADIEAYFHGYFDPIAQALGPLVGKSLRYMTMDSWEAEMQNWTDDMIADFRRLRGYDPVPYLPALAGRVVGSADISDRFLWDFRRTVADLLADAHYGTMETMARQHGLGIYSEASGVSLDFNEDTLLNKSKVDIPMGEFWVHALHPELMYYQDVRGAASASHIYGKNLVATESFTGGGYEAPYTLKKIGDYWLAQGVNRIVFHTSAHQPLDTKPGNTMVGTHINRNITWAEEAKPYMTYLARNMFLLQQGKFVADLAYLLPEGAPSTMPIWGAGLQPALPEGYDYDYVNADVLLNRMSVAPDGRLTLPDGMSYRILVLPPIQSMTLPVLRKIRDLVAGGATVLGPKPLQSPSLTGYPNADAEMQALAADVWGDLDGISRFQRVYGKGGVVWGLPPAEALARLHVAKDFECTRALDAETQWIHRRDGDTDIYYVANQGDRAVSLEARFRVAGREAELWHPDTGEIEPAGYTIAGDRTTAPLDLAERETVFVVFRKATATMTRTIPRAVSTTVATVSGPWDVAFPANFGAPAKVQLAKLESWTANTDDGVKYFSGTATYSKSVQAPAGWFRPGAKVLLDLGTVKDLAEVSVNGKPLGILWKAPYRVDATGALKAGANRLEIKVTNEWTNRQIGDRLLPVEKRVLAQAAPMFGAPVAAAPAGRGAAPAGAAAAGRGGAPAGRGGAAPAAAPAGGLGGRGGPQVPAESGLMGPVTVISQGGK